MEKKPLELANQRGKEKRKEEKKLDSESRLGSNFEIRFSLGSSTKMPENSSFAKIPFQISIISIYNFFNLFYLPSTFSNLYLFKLLTKYLIIETYSKIIILYNLNICDFRLQRHR